MEKFNAEDAKKLVDEFYLDEYSIIINNIIKESKNGKSSLIIENEISYNSVLKLEKAGFNVFIQPISMAKENLYCTISW